MKKLTIFLMTLLLAGCVTDHTAEKPYKLDDNFIFDENELYIEIRQKATEAYYFQHLYKIYTTSEQAAYLLAGDGLLTTKLNGIPIQALELSVDEVIETSNDTIYELYPYFKVTDEQMEKIGDEITSFTISNGNKEIFSFEHSPIYVNHNYYRFTLEGGYKEHENDVASLGLKNQTANNLAIKQLFLEDIYSNRLVMQEKHINFKVGDTIKLPFNRKLLEDNGLEGVIGVYALLEDGQEIFLTEAPYTIENYHQQQLEQFIQSVESRRKGTAAS